MPLNLSQTFSFILSFSEVCWCLHVQKKQQQKIVICSYVDLTNKRKKKMEIDLNGNRFMLFVFFHG